MINFRKRSLAARLLLVATACFFGGAVDVPQQPAHQIFLGIGLIALVAGLTLVIAALPSGVGLAQLGGYK